MLGLDRVFQRRGGVERQQVLNGREVVFAHGAVIGRQAEYALADLEAAMSRINGFDYADHFVARFTGLRGIAAVRQVMDMADIAAAEGQAQGLDDGVVRAQLGLWRFDNNGLAAGDYLDSFHLMFSPGRLEATALSIASFGPFVRRTSGALWGLPCVRMGA